MYNPDVMNETAHKIVQEILKHDDNPIHGDEVVIPLFLDTQEGIELIRIVATQLRASGTPVWISANQQTMIHRQIRMYVDANGAANPISARGETALMFIIDRHTSLSRYGQGVLAGTMTNALVNARLAGYQGQVIALEAEDADEED